MKFRIMNSELSAPRDPHTRNPQLEHPQPAPPKKPIAFKIKKQPVLNFIELLNN